MFDNEETAIIILKKLLPALEELARAEFGPYSITGNIDEETLQWIRERRKALMAVAERYMDGLMEAHIRTGMQLRESETLGQNLSSNGNDVGN